MGAVEAAHRSVQLIESLVGDLGGDRVEVVDGRVKANRFDDGWGAGFESVLAGVPRGMPSLLRALRLAEKAATVGFDWQHGEQVLGKVREELDELEEAIGGGNVGRMKDELGDLLMSLANLGRHLEIEPEDALRAANDRFSRRFQHLEQAICNDGQDIASLSLAQLEDRWQQAKAALAGGDETG